MAYEKLGAETFDLPSGSAFSNAFKAAAAEGAGSSLSRAHPAIADAVRAGAASMGRFQDIVNELTSGKVTKKLYSRRCQDDRKPTSGGRS